MSSGDSMLSVAEPVAIPAVVVPRLEAEPITKSTVLALDEMEGPRSYDLAGGVAAVYTHRSPIKTTCNEDVVALVPLGPRKAVLIIADGLGGHANGEEAAHLTVKTIAKTLQKSEDDDLRPAILNGIESANDAVCALANGSASTLALAEIQDGTVRTYHVGDSCILLTGGLGRVKLQTIAHSPIGYAVEAGLLDEVDAIHHEDRHVISNVIGDTEMRIEIGPPVKMARRDTLLLASDGLFDNLLPEEVIEISRKGPAARAVGKLASQTMSRMVGEGRGTPSKPDDLSIIAFRLKG